MASIRLGGLASGMDTEAMVKELMKAHQLKMTNFERKKTGLNWEKEVWQDLNKKVLNFQQKTLFDMKLGKTLGSRKIKTTATNFSVSGKGNADNGNHTVKVNQVATKPRVNKEMIISEYTQTLSSLAGTDIDDSDVITIKINDKDLVLKGTDTIDDVVKKMDQLEGANVSARYFTDGNFLRFTTDNSGENAELKPEATGAKGNKVLELLGLDGLTSPGVDADGNPIVVGIKGQNAKLEFDGMEVESSTNVVKVAGLEIEVYEASTDVKTITVSSDIDKDVESIKKVIEEYNSMLAEVNKYLYAKANNSYEPLTDEERKAMDDDEVKLWEEKVKGSMLRNNDILKSFSNLARGTISSQDIYGKLSQFGITTGDYSERGKLHIDEEKLKKALENDPTAIEDTFRNIGEKMHDGIASMLKATKTSSALTMYHDKTIKEDLRTNATDIIEYQKKLDTIEANYNRQFTAMEKMIQQLNSQSSSIAGMFGS